MHELEYKGTWYLPGKSRKKDTGILKFSAGEGAHLDVHGTFMNTDDIFEIVRPDIILGVSSTGEHITLYNSFEKNYTGSTSVFYARIVLVGMHFTRAADIKFNALYLQHVYVNDWANISTINVALTPPTGLLIRYEQVVSRVLLAQDDY